MTDTCEFAICRPYFDFSRLKSEEEMLQRERMINKWLSERLPNNIPTSSIEVATNCFASICYHYKFLQANLHKKCVLRNSILFKDIPQEFIAVAVTAFPWNKTKYTPSFTGIPPHVVQLAELKELKLKLAELKEGVMTSIVAAMDERGLASS